MDIINVIDIVSLVSTICQYNIAWLIIRLWLGCRLCAALFRCQCHCRPNYRVMFHQDNVPAHTSSQALAAIQNVGFKLLPRPPYSPDLAPSDFCFLNWRNSWMDAILLTMRAVSARQMAGWKTKIIILLQWNPSFGGMLDQVHFTWKETVLKSDKIWCAHVMVICVRLRTFWTPLVYPIFFSSKISDIFDIFKIRYFPYFFNITLLLDVKTSLKCKNRHFKFSILLII